MADKTAKDGPPLETIEPAAGPNPEGLRHGALAAQLRDEDKGENPGELPVVEETSERKPKRRGGER